MPYLTYFLCQQNYRMRCAKFSNVLWTRFQYQLGTLHWQKQEVNAVIKMNPSTPESSSNSAFNDPDDSIDVNSLDADANDSIISVP